MAADPIEWGLTHLLGDRTEPGTGVLSRDVPARPFALVILNQPLENLSMVKTLWKKAFLKVAADGGANRVLEVCNAEHEQDSSPLDNLDVIIGDLDSLEPAAREHFTTTSQPARVIHDPDQYTTDFSKAVRYVRENYQQHEQSDSTSTSSPPDIVALGGLGGRVDQALSQLHHLHLFQTDSDYSQGRMFLISRESVTFVLKAGRLHRVRVRDLSQDDSKSEDIFDKYVGIVPVKGPSRITTRGLEWDVQDWSTEIGGQLSTSNHVLPETEVVEVETTEDVLFTIALRKTS